LECVVEVSNRSSPETRVDTTAAASTIDLPSIIAITVLSIDTFGSPMSGGSDAGGVASGEFQQ